MKAAVNQDSFFYGKYSQNDRKTTRAVPAPTAGAARRPGQNYGSQRMRTVDETEVHNLGARRLASFGTTNNYER
jgi:hypothetical protein